MLDWQAHGFKYAIPAAYADELATGRTVIANVSRSIIEEAIARYSPANAGGVGITRRPRPPSRQPRS